MMLQLGVLCIHGCTYFYEVGVVDDWLFGNIGGYAFVVNVFLR